MKRAHVGWVTVRRAVMLHATLAITFAASTAMAKAGTADGASVRLAVLALENTSGDAALDPLGKGLQSMLATDLAKVSALTLVERDRLAEIEKELKLGRSGKVDKRTAAKVGKLLGATHLTGGSFTVVGETMRIDVRVFEVRTGKVLLGEEITGEKEAFFELEKALIKKLVRALGIKLPAKERAKIATIHTADFEAFTRFSQGVEHFAAGRRDEAMAALRDAARIDAEFELARVTLDDYGRVAAGARAKAEKLGLARRQMEAAKVDEQNARLAAVAEKLQPIVEGTAAPGTGKGRDATVHRLAALSMLSVLFDIRARNNGRYSRFQDTGDLFAMRRTYGAMARRWLADSLGLFPRVPLFLPSSGFPDKVADVPRRVRGKADHWAGKTAHARRAFFQDRSRHALAVRATVKDLKLDERGELALWLQVISQLEKLQRVAKKNGADERETKAISDAMVDAWQKLASVQAGLARYDEAVASQGRVSALTTSSYDLKRAATTIEGLRKKAAWLAASKHPDVAREWLVLGRSVPRPNSREQGWFAGAKPADALWRDMNGRRGVETWHSHHEHPIFLGAPAKGDPIDLAASLGPAAPVPTFLIAGRRISTDARLGPKRARALRYDRLPRDPRDVARGRPERLEPDLVALLGRAPVDDGTLRFTASFARPADHFPRHARYKEGLTREQRMSPEVSMLELSDERPTVSVLFGCRDIERRAERDPETREYRYDAPMTCLGLRIEPDAVVLVRFVDAGPAADEPGYKVSSLPMADKELARARLKVGTPRQLKVRVQWKKDRATVHIGGAGEVSLPLPADHGGFVGWHARGRGFVQLADPDLS